MASKRGYWASLHGLATLLMIGAALYFLFVEHRAHVIQYLPYLILLLCPLMHLFMHKGHNAHGHEDHQHQSTEEAYRRGLEEGRKQADKR